MKWHLAEVCMGVILLFLVWRSLMPAIKKARLKITKDRVTVIFLTFSVLTVGWIWAVIFNIMRNGL